MGALQSPEAMHTPSPQLCASEASGPLRKRSLRRDVSRLPSWRALVREGEARAGIRDAPSPMVRKAGSS